MGLMILATGLYINACAKGEHMIPQTVRPYILTPFIADAS
jgi:hypothetical protein